jgi:GNAT superfamily N-acetyltransferase
VPLDDAIVIREATPADARFLDAGFERLSDESRYHRFFSAMPVLPSSLKRRLADVDGVSSAAVVAVDRSDPERAPVGVARWNTDSAGVAHMAIVVVDDFQRQGIGRALLGALYDLAVDRGVTTMRADVLATNETMKRLVASFGNAQVVPDDDPTVTTYHIDPHRAA